MPLDFKTLPMMELRSAPGEILDRVAHKSEAFIVERNGNQMACLVPLSAFMPDIQPARLAQELERLEGQGERHAISISDSRELELRFREDSSENQLIVTIRLPHGYPSACPKVFIHPLPNRCPHRWQDGSVCIFGALDVWNPGQHDVPHVLRLTRRWISNFAEWQKTGKWGYREGSNE